VTEAALRGLVAGAEVHVPVRDGERRYVNLDNAASPPPFGRVLEAVQRFAPWYANVHRGTGFKSRLSTWALEEARAAIGRFVGADPESDVVVLTRNATGALNRIARRVRADLGNDGVVLATVMEHHSNDLPWRDVAPVEYIPVDRCGRLDDDQLRRRLRRGGVGVLAVTAASNVTGIVNPVHTYARWAHQAGARIVVDAAQLVPHRPLDVRSPDDPEHLDFVAFSAHKLYAPFGVGVLVGPRALLGRGAPDEVGGGTVDSVGLDHVDWAGLPDREEAGTPCVIGAVALAAAIRVYADLGWDAIVAHEDALTARALAALAGVPDLTLYGDAGASAGGRLGVLAFNLAGLPHGLVAAILAHEWGIGTRSGCFCAHPYVKALLGVSDAEAEAQAARLRAGDRRDLPGAVRVSLGVYNTAGDLERLDEALHAIAAGRHGADYALDPASGEWRAASDAAGRDFAAYCPV
jgi:selenocysteine lyase/cysteine desulfurase